MQAIMIKDDYPDLVMDFPYEVDKVYWDSHIRLKNSPRIYTGSSFEIRHNGKKITLQEARRLYQLDVVMRKLGIK